MKYKAACARLSPAAIGWVCYQLDPDWSILDDTRDQRLIPIPEQTAPFAFQLLAEDS